MHKDRGYGPYPQLLSKRKDVFFFFFFVVVVVSFPLNKSLFMGNISNLGWYIILHPDIFTLVGTSFYILTHLTLVVVHHFTSLHNLIILPISIYMLSCMHTIYYFCLYGLVYLKIVFTRICVLIQYVSRLRTVYST